MAVGPHTDETGVVHFEALGTNLSAFKLNSNFLPLQKRLIMTSKWISYYMDLNGFHSILTKINNVVKKQYIHDKLFSENNFRMGLKSENL